MGHTSHPAARPPEPLPAPSVPNATLSLVLGILDSRLAYLRACDGSYVYEQDLLTIRREIVDRCKGTL